MKRPFASGFETIVALRAAAAFRRRVRQPGHDQSLILQTVESHVDGSQRYALGARQFLDLGMDRDAVGVIAKSEDRRHHQLLELTEGNRVHHLSYSEWLIGRGRQGANGPNRTC